MMRRSVRDAGPLRGRPRRLIVFAFYDEVGRVDPFVTYSLAGLRPHADRILVVVNGQLNPEGRIALAEADEILVRENSGFDIGAHRAALRHLAGTLEGFDEIVLTNDTWYGPINSWAPVMETMNGRPCHFWGLTDHARTKPNPITGKGTAPYHLQSYWIAIRREMFLSDDWDRYWRDLGPLRTYNDAVLGHELPFTGHFTDRGWIADVAFPCSDRDTENPSLFEAEALIEDGCPALKRRPLFHWPPLLISRAALGARTLAAASARGYPTDLILRNLARTVPPGAVNADAGLLTVLSGTLDSVAAAAPRTLVSAHVDGDDVSWIFDRAANVGEYGLIVTVGDGAAARRARRALAEDPRSRGVHVSVVTSAASADVALFDGCRGPLLSGEYDLVARLVSPGDPVADLGRGAGDPLGTRDTWLQVSAMFDREAGLGIVFPPTPHLGRDVMGEGWRGGKDSFASLARRIGISVPLDDVSPLAPVGTTFVARPAALRLLAEHDWSREEHDGIGGEAVTAALSRMPAYAAGELGFYTRTVTTAEYLSMSHPFLEFVAEEMSATIPGDAYQKVDFLRHSGPVGSGTGRDLLRMYSRRRHLGLVRVARRVTDPRRLPGRWLAAVRSRGR